MATKEGEGGGGGTHNKGLRKQWEDCEKKESQAIGGIRSKKS